MERFLIALVLLASLVACASKSEDIAPAYVSSIGYAGYNCQQLAAEGERLSAAAAQAAGVQDSKRSRDQAMVGVGAVLFWPALLFTEGDGQTAAQLAQLKGQMNALQIAANEKQCGFQYRQ